MKELIEQVAVLAELQKQTTPGPWRQAAHPSDGSPSRCVDMGPRNPPGAPFAVCHGDDAPQRENAAFIAAAGSFDFAALHAALAAALASPVTPQGVPAELYGLPFSARVDGQNEVKIYNNYGDTVCRIIGGNDEAGHALREAKAIAAACNATLPAAAPSLLGGGAAPNYKGLTAFYIVANNQVKSYYYVAQCKAENYHILKEQGSELPIRIRYDELDKACSTEQAAWAMLALALEDEMRYVKDTILPQFDAAAPTQVAIGGSGRDE